LRQRDLASAPPRRYRAAGAGRFVGRFLGRRRRASGTGRDRHGHRWIDPPAGGLHRHFGHQADLWPLFASGHRGLRQLARPGRADGARRARSRDHAGGDGGVRPEGRDFASARRAQVGARPERQPPRQAHRHPQGISRRRHAAGDRGAVAARDRSGARRGGGDRRGFAAPHQIRAAGLLHHRAGGGILQPRPLRRRPLRP
ncbi:hypothetical protein OY671_009662, partial [Metschnikowia pulcherrima]